MSKAKNIIIFIAIGVALFLIYSFFIKAPADTGALVFNSPDAVVVDTAMDDKPAVARDFLNLLLSVTGIKLNDAIFSDNAFNALRDSSITLIQDGNEGRPNPFAPFGVNDSIPLIPVESLNPQL